MSAALSVLEVLLIPAGILPVATAVVLFRYRRSASPSLRDRWHLSLVLAALGATTSLIALAVLTGRGGGWLWIPFAIALLAADLVSGKWLLEFWRGRFR